MITHQDTLTVRTRGADGCPCRLAAGLPNG